MTDKDMEEEVEALERALDERQAEADQLLSEFETGLRSYSDEQVTKAQERARQEMAAQKAELEQAHLGIDDRLTRSVSELDSRLERRTSRLVEQIDELRSETQARLESQSESFNGELSKLSDQVDRLHRDLEQRIDSLGAEQESNLKNAIAGRKRALTHHLTKLRSELEEIQGSLSANLAERHREIESQLGSETSRLDEEANLSKEKWRRIFDAEHDSNRAHFGKLEEYVCKLEKYVKYLAGLWALLLVVLVILAILSQGSCSK